MPEISKYPISDFSSENLTHTPEEQPSLDERGTMFSRIVLSLLEKHGLTLQDDGAALLIGDIGCGSGSEIPYLIQAIQDKVPQKKIRLLALDPIDDLRMLQDIAAHLQIPEGIISPIHDSGRSPEVFDRIKIEATDKYQFFVLRNPDIHSNTWKSTFKNMYDNLADDGMLQITCENDFELSNILDELKPFGYQITVYDTSPNNYTHVAYKENNWIIAKKIKKIE